MRLRKNDTPSEETLKQIAALTITDDTYSKTKYLTLDVYGTSAVDDLITAEKEDA